LVEGSLARARRASNTYRLGSHEWAGEQVYAGHTSRQVRRKATGTA
jgi:hypothetical protein